MEDGVFDTLESLGENIRGLKHVKKPYIQTLEGKYPVEEGKHYIVTGIKGERYPVEKEIFHESYTLVEDAHSFKIADIVRVKSDIYKGEYSGIYEISGINTSTNSSAYQFDCYITNNECASEYGVKSEDLILVCRAEDREDL